MHLVTRNVNTAFRDLVALFSGGEIAHHVRNRDRIKIEAEIVKKPSRNGNVMMIDEPVTITYTRPKERVLFNAARDANPFFHLYEALWMLAGRNDVDAVAYYAKQMREYSDDGRTLNGAYGYRWRRAHTMYDDGRDVTAGDDVDQLDILVNHLKADPTSRRAVLQMWNVEDDLLKIEAREPCREVGCVKGMWVNGRGRAMLEEGAKCPVCKGSGKSGKDFSKDVCCNLSVMFSIRHVPHFYYDGGPDCGEDLLDMTVTNRSNDMIWGLLGANYVHFTFLQEYMAARLDCEVGKYHHFTNNLHVYDWNWKPEEWLNDRQQDWYGRGAIRENGPITNTFPLITDHSVFDNEVVQFAKRYSKEAYQPASVEWTEPFLRDVAEPMMLAFNSYKRKSAPTMSWVQKIKADDWRIACSNWIERRLNK